MVIARRRGLPIIALLFLSSLCSTLALTGKINLDAFGGDPVVSSEIGAEPQQMDEFEPETCHTPGIELKTCDQDCVYGCRTPLCTLGCVCSCKGAQNRARLVAVLKQQRKALQMLQQQNGISKTALAPRSQQNGFLSNPFAGIPFGQQGKAKGVNPRFMGSKLAKAQQHKRRVENAAAQQNRLEQQRLSHGTDKTGFSWLAYDHDDLKQHRHPDPDLAGYAAESDNIDDVFDPSEDWGNLGEDPQPKGRWFAHNTNRQGFKDRWWVHDKDIY